MKAELFLTVAYSIFVSFVNPVFFSGINLSNVLRQAGFIIIPALGMTLVLIAGGLDLSVGSVIAVSGLVTGICLVDFQLPIWLCVIMGMFTGGVFGFINGFIIIRFSVTPIIVTLGMMYIGRGLALVITGGMSKYPLPAGFDALEQGTALGLPNIIPLYIILCLVFYFLLTQTTFGRSVYAVGGNRATAKLSGIYVNKIQTAVYIISGITAGLAGVMMSSRLGSSQPYAGTGQEMHVIASCIIGGTSTLGGKGSVLGTLIGSVFMAMLTNSMTLMKVNVNWQNTVLGTVLVFAVVLDQYKRIQSQKISIKLD